MILGNWHRQVGLDTRPGSVFAASFGFYDTRYRRGRLAEAFRTACGATVKRLSINTFLSEDFLYYSGFSTGRDVLNLSVVGENEFVDIQAEQSKQSCLVIVGSDDIFDSSMAELVG